MISSVVLVARHLDFGVENELVLLCVVGAPRSRRHSRGLREWQPGESQPSAVTVRVAITTGMGCFSPFASPSPKGSFVCASVRLFRPRIVLHTSASNLLDRLANPMIP